jgi:hypothetical protein
VKPSTVWLFRDEQDLLDAVANGLPAALDHEELWQRDIDGRPPHCRDSTRIDLTALPLLAPETENTLIDALGVLENRPGRSVSWSPRWTPASPGGERFMPPAGGNTYRHW